MKIFSTFLILCLIGLVFGQEEKPINPADAAALADLQQAGAWTPSDDLCDHVNCIEMGSYRYVQRISLRGRQVSGTIPSSIGQLTYLQYLDLSTNLLSGTIPPSLGSLHNLIEMDLSLNQFEGSIPVELANLNSLQQLRLDHNQLEGTIPSIFQTMTQLSKLDLTSNNLRGSLPTFLPKMTGLRQLFLGSNKFEGTIPTIYGDFQQLYYLDLHSNNITGTIPASFGPHISAVDFHSNHLSGTIPSLASWPNYTYILDFSDNELTGTIPERITSMTINHFNMSHNFLSGTFPVPADSWKTSLNFLSVSYNQLYGCINATFMQGVQCDFSYNLFCCVPTNCLQEGISCSQPLFPVDRQAFSGVFDQAPSLEIETSPSIAVNIDLPSVETIAAELKELYSQIRTKKRDIRLQVTLNLVKSALWLLDQSDAVVDAIVDPPVRVVAEIYRKKEELKAIFSLSDLKVDNDNKRATSPQFSFNMNHQNDKSALFASFRYEDIDLYYFAFQYNATEHLVNNTLSVQFSWNVTAVDAVQEPITDAPSSTSMASSMTSSIALVVAIFILNCLF